MVFKVWVKGVLLIDFAVVDGFVRSFIRNVPETTKNFSNNSATEVPMLRCRDGK